MTFYADMNANLKKPLLESVVPLPIVFLTLGNTATLGHFD